MGHKGHGANWKPPVTKKEKAKPTSEQEIGKELVQISLKLKRIANSLTSIAGEYLKVGSFGVYLAIMGCLLLGCQSHYTLIIIASPEPGRTVDAMTPSSPDEARSLSKESELAPTTPALTKPLSITPGNFSAEQNKGGAMVNVLLNLNLVKPVSTSTDANLQLQGIPGMP